jgi:hypothetical protein
VNSIHWFSNQRAHSCLHINFAASQWAATIDPSVSTYRSTGALSGASGFRSGAGW